MLLFTIAELMGKNSMAVILAGTGKDGVEGVKEVEVVERESVPIRSLPLLDFTSLTVTPL